MDVTARANVLSTSPTFGFLPRHELMVLAEMMRTEAFAARSTVFEVGEPAGAVFVIASGRLAVTLPGRDGVVRSLGPGDVVGEYGMLVGFVRTATVHAEDAAVLLSLDYERFRAYLLRFPEAMLGLFELAVRRLVGAERRAAGP